MAYRSNNLVTGLQLRAARTLAGMTQRDLATMLGINERAVRFWEKKRDRRRTSAPNDARIEQAILARGVILFAEPTPSLRPGREIRVSGELIPLRWHACLPVLIFGCPQCGCNCYRLYCATDRWACRKCHRLDYASRHGSRFALACASILYRRRRIAASPELFSPVVARKHGRVRSQALADKIAAEIRELEARLVDYLRTDINDVLERRIKLRGLK